MNLPEAFKERMSLYLEDEYESFLASYDEKPKKGLRVNLLKGTVEDFMTIDPWGIGKQRVSFCPDGFIFDEIKDESAPGKHPLFQTGAYYIQEPSAMVVAEKLNVKKGDRVLDLCASPGGKSTQIAAKLCKEGLLVSNEPVLQRAKVLSENIERMGVSNCLVTCAYPDELSARFEGYFDKIVVDAPCSGEGMFRKNEEAANEWSPENVLMCAERQRQILREAYKMLRTGGMMIYSTCTFAKEEDEENVQWFLNEYDDLKLIESEKLYPHKIQGEGHFYALFSKGEPTDIEKRPVAACGNEKPDSKAGISDFFDFEKSFLKDDIEKTIFGGRNMFKLFKDELYILPEDFPSMRGLKVLRSCLHLGTLKKGRFEPSHALAMYLKKEDVKNYVTVTEREARDFVKGMSLSANGNPGWNLVVYEGYSLGFGKLSQNILKNHYPKGLRIQC